MMKFPKLTLIITLSILYSCCMVLGGQEQSQHERAIEFISQQISHFTTSNEEFHNKIITKDFTSLSSWSATALKQSDYSSCSPVPVSIQDCSGYIPNNVSYIIAHSLNIFESRLVTNIDNFLMKIESIYGTASNLCENSARNYFCSGSFRRCEESDGFVTLIKPCQYLCTNLYMNCIPDQKAAKSSALNYCGTIDRPSQAYDVMPVCTDVYMDRTMNGYIAMGLVFMVCGLACSGIFITCFVMIGVADVKLKRRERGGLEERKINIGIDGGMDGGMDGGESRPFSSLGAGISNFGSTENGNDDHFEHVDTSV